MLMGGVASFDRNCNAEHRGVIRRDIAKRKKWNNTRTVGISTLILSLYHIKLKISVKNFTVSVSVVLI